MPTKYYAVENCRRRISAAGIVFAFQATHHFAGTWFGEYSTDKPEEQAALAQLTVNPKSGVTEVTAEEHAELLKKKLSLPERSRAIQPVQPPLTPTPVAVADRAGRLVGEVQLSEPASPAAPQPKLTPPVDDGEPVVLARAEDAIQLGKVPSLAQTEARAPGNKSFKK
jgi:hypothetical protein